MVVATPDGPEVVEAVLNWAEYDDERSRVLERLELFHEWLATEAIAAGGIGPAEVSRLWNRHLADSLTFLAGLGDESNVVDVGTGVGLPGIPLAIALPAVGFTLLDRSEERGRLARRAIRVLDLDNAAVVVADAGQVTLPHGAAVARAVRSPEELTPIMHRLLPMGRIAVIGGSRQTAPPVDAGFELIEVPEDVLGDAAWLAKVTLSGGGRLCSPA